MKEIYDEKYKGKERSSSKNSRKNEYSSTESYENIMSQYRKSTEMHSVSAKCNKKLSDSQKIHIDEVTYSHKKPKNMNQFETIKSIQKY